MEVLIKQIRAGAWKESKEYDWYRYDTILGTLVYADKVNNVRLARLALQASWLVLEATRSKLQEAHLDKCKGLLPDTERKLRRYHEEKGLQKGSQA